MPSSIAAWLTSIGFSAGAAAVIANVFVSLVVSYAISAATRRDPRRPRTADEFANRLVNSLQSDEEWQILYGQARVAGAYRFRHVTDTTVNAITTDEVNVPASSPFTVQVQYAADWLSNVHVVEILVYDDYSERTFTEVASNPGPLQYSVAAGIYTFNSADAGLRLHILYNRTNVVSQAHNRLHLVIVLAAHEVEEIGDIYFNDEIVPLDGAGNATGRYAGYVYVSKHLGAADQAADATLMTEAPSKWTLNHRLRGHAYVYVRLIRNGDLFPGVVPNISAIVKGRKVFDPRTGLTGWTQNAALHLSDYLTRPVWGLEALYASEIDETVLIAAANVCDEAVALATATTTFTASAGTDTLTLVAGAKQPAIGDGVRVSSAGILPGGLAAATTYYAIHAAGGLVKLATTLANARAGTAIDITSAGTGTHTLTYFNEPRYCSNGVLKTLANPQDIIRELLTAMSGRAVYVGGKWRIRAGAYLAPTLTLTETDAGGPLQVTTRLSRRDLFNAVKGRFVSPANNWQPSDYPPVKNATYLAEDGAERVWREHDLPYTTSASMAQRLAKIELERVRQQISVMHPLKLGAYRAEPPEAVQLTNARMGWTAKPFELAESRLNFTAEALSVEYVLRETAATVFDWNSGEETAFDPAPDTTLPNPFSIDAPAGVQVFSGTSELFIGPDGTVISRMRVTWSAPAIAHVIAGGQAQCQYKKAADLAWRDAESVPGGATTLYIWSVDDGAQYDVRVRFQNSIGTRSTWTMAARHTVIGKSAPPSDVTGFTSSFDGPSTLLRWTKITDVDVAEYEVRLGASWASATLVGKTRADFLRVEALAAATTYLIKAFDTTRHESATAASVTVTPLAPGQVAHSSAFDGGDIKLTWATPGGGSYPVARYEVRHGATWVGGTSVGFVDVTTFRALANWLGSRTWWVTAIDVAGRESTPGSVEVVVTKPSAPVITPEVIDNNVLLRWTDATQTLPIKHYEVRRGATFATATVIGTVQARFSLIFESSSGLFVYWIVGVDSAGNYGTETGLSITVSQPPDFVLYDDSVSQLDSTNRSNWLRTRGANYALSLNGSTQYGSTPSDSAFDLSSALSIECMIKNGNEAATDGHLITREGWFTLAYGQVSAGRVRFFDRNGSGAWCNFPTDGGWHHVVGVKNGPNVSDITIYVDGAAQTMNVVGTWNPLGGANALSLGAALSGGSPLVHFNGQIALARLYGRALSAAEVAEHYHGIFKSETNLVAAWGMDEGTGTTAFDDTDNARDLALFNTPPWVATTLDGRYDSTLGAPKVYLPVKAEESVSEYATRTGYLTPQAAVDAGSLHPLTPAMTTGQYVEVIDFGVVVPSTKIVLALTDAAFLGTVTITPTISVRQLATDPWTDFVGVFSVFTTAFRYVKITLNISAAGGNHIRTLTQMLTRLDVKLINDAGEVNCNAGDVGGTTVTFNVAFLDVQSITVTPKGTTARTAVYDFTDVPNPTTFKALLFDSSAARVSGLASWSAKGV